MSIINIEDMSSITVSKESKKIWESFKNYPQESFEKMINRILKQQVEDDVLTKEDLQDIQEGVDDIKAGRVFTTEELKRELGL
jgi:hypothetical protein